MTSTQQPVRVVDASLARLVLRRKTILDAIDMLRREYAQTFQTQDQLLDMRRTM